MGNKKNTQTNARRTPSNEYHPSNEYYPNNEYYPSNEYYPNPPTSALAVSSRRVRLYPPDPPLLGPDFKKNEGGGSQLDPAWTLTPPKLDQILDASKTAPGMILASFLPSF